MPRGKALGECAERSLKVVFTDEISPITPFRTNFIKPCILGTFLSSQLYAKDHGKLPTAVATHVPIAPENLQKIVCTSVACLCERREAPRGVVHVQNTESVDFDAAKKEIEASIGLERRLHQSNRVYDNPPQSSQD